MNDKQLSELKFWTELINKEGEDGFIRRRRADFYRHMNNFDGWCDLSGDGVEFGTGCYSMLSSCNGNVMGIDPLADEFAWILPKTFDSSVKHLKGDGENTDFIDGQFDWAVCWNVIDHTPNPEKMINELKRVIKKGGKIYLEVNFDDKLNTFCHYKLWNELVVAQYFGNFKCLFSKIVDNPQDQQKLFYAVYEV